MTDEARAMLSADDAELLNMVRAGETAAFQVLYQRHEQAVRRLARDLVVTAADADDVVAETFARMLEVTRLGGGPADAFRPHILRALRQVCDERLAAARQARVRQPQAPGDDDGSGSGSGEPAGDQVVTGRDGSLIVRAFLALPERWIAVLWHTDIEDTSPAEVTPLLGLSPDGVAALRRQARAGLRQAYLQTYASDIARPECTAVALRLGAFVRDAVSGPDSAMVTGHLSQCDDCRAAFAELSDVRMPLRAMVAPVFLGDSADYYLSGTAPRRRAGTSPAATAGAAGATAPGTGRPWRLWPSGPVRPGARRLRWVAVGGAAAIAAGAVVFAASLAGHGTPLKQAGRDQAQAPDGAAPVAPPSATPVRSASPPAASPVAATRAGSPPGDAPASPAPLPATSPAPPAVRLAAAVNVYPQHQRKSAMVVFQVSDTGSARTGELAVSVALPAGTSLVNWPPGHDHWQGHGGQDGWSCHAIASGARCRHSPIPAGSQSQGVLFIGIGGSSACGQPVSVTATSAAASASARSPQDIQC